VTAPRTPASDAVARWLRRACTLDLRSLAVFRVGIGLLVTADALLRSRDVSWMFAPDGMFPLAVLRRYLGDPCAWSLATVVDASWCGPAILTLEAVAGVLLAAGCGTRLATGVAWLAVVSVLRRTAPATNAGDAWLACLLFWGMFLPLGSVWSWDHWQGRRLRRTFENTLDTRDGQRAAAGRETTAVWSAATAALVLQIAVVYLSAGLSKWNDSWLSGDAVRFAMSVHDHGTPLGEWLVGSGRIAGLLSRIVPALEILGPLILIAVPVACVRGSVVALFLGFHMATCTTMTVGLFGYVGLAAWLALLPGEAWDRLSPPGEPRRSRSPATLAMAARAPGRQAAIWTGAAAGILALISLVHDITPWRNVPLPGTISSLINLVCMHQEWSMFGRVERQEQWVYARAERADGRVIDLLRSGRPIETERPAGGFTSLPNNRWHKLFWVLPRPRQRVFAPDIARTLAEHWNARHPAAERVVAVEIRFARLGLTAADNTLHELLLAAWPPRNNDGRGNLERLLKDTAPSPSPAAGDHQADVSTVD